MSKLLKDFWKWGKPESEIQLRDYPKFQTFLEEKWSRKLVNDFQSPDLARLVPESSFTETDFTKTFPALSLNQFSNDKKERISNGFGKSYHDIIRVLTGKFPPLADFVLFPETEADVIHILSQASSHHIKVVPFGGGSNVTGAFELNNENKSCSVNLQRLNRLIEIDEDSHTATFETGVFGPELEEKLNAKGFTLGHFPQSFEYSTLGGWIATRSGGQESGQYGKIEDMVLGIRAVTPNSIIAATQNYPRHAAGVDTYRLFLGSEGTLGIVTLATLRIERMPQKHLWIVGLFKTFDEATAAVRETIQCGIHPGILRLSDALETKLLSTMRSGESKGLKRLISKLTKSYLGFKDFKEPCVLMMRFSIRSDADIAIAKTAQKIIKKKNGFLLPSSAAGNWEEHRFTLPYLRDSLIEHRIMIDTFETIAFWKDVSILYSEVKDSLKKSGFYEDGGMIFCHISHVYESAACLYFTILAPQEKGDEESQWTRYKTTVTNALIKAGGAVSHHHGIGRDHQHWYLKKTSQGEKELLRAIKTHLDPNHIMNPGKLFDEN
ncbi:MAG: FAD-binding oxidoreductase [Pyrinomonadaceae bacterium]